MSETELELAPIEEDEHETPAASAPGAGSGSGVVGGPTGSSDLLKDEQEMAEGHDDRSETEAAAQLPDLDEQDDAPPVEVIDELPALDQPSASDSSHDGLFGALPLEDGLDSLGDSDQAASLNAIDSSPGLGALESDIRKMPVGSSASSSSSTRQKSVASEKPKTLWESITSVGLPIVVGVVGGGILVVIVLLVFVFTGPKSPDRSGAAPRVARTGAGSPPIEVMGQPEQQPGPDAPPAHDEQQPREATSEDGSFDQPDESGAMLADSTMGQQRGTSQPPIDERQERASEEPDQQPAAAVQPDGLMAQESAVDPSAESSAGQPEIGTSDPQAGRDRPQATLGADAALGGSTPESVEPVHQPAPRVSRNQVFATINEFSLDVKTEAAEGGGGQNNKAAKNAEAQAKAFRLGIEKALKYALKTTRLKLVDNSETAVMNITITVSMVDGFNVIELAASLDCRYRGSDPASVWDIEKTEVMKFRSGTKERLLTTMWDTNSREFFRPLRAAHEQAMQTAGQ